MHTKSHQQNQAANQPTIQQNKKPSNFSFVAC